MAAEPPEVLAERRGPIAPFLSVCIPQYGRTPFLLAALRTLEAQTLRPLEVCISDDRSTDGGAEQIQAELERSTLDHVFTRNPSNLRYDGNLRAALDLARGEYCFLLGNDDGLEDERVLEELAGLIRACARPPGVVVANYRDSATGALYRRVRRTGVEAGGPATAAACYRSFSFLGGVILRKDLVHRFRTDRWDGSEFYQTFLACCALAAGEELLEWERTAVRMGLQLRGLEVESYARRPKARGLAERRLNLDALARLVVDAISTSAPADELRPIAARIALQTLAFTYPFWLIEYRRVQSWSFAAGVCLGMRPARLLDPLPLSLLQRAALTAVYGAASVAGLTVPIAAFDLARWRLYDLAKSTGRRG